MYIGMSGHKAKELESLMWKYDKEKERGFSSSSDPSEEIYNGVLSKKA